MPADSSVHLGTMSRANTMLNRPQNVPLGPRTRSRSSNILSELASPPISPPISPPYVSINTSFTSLSGGNLYLPEFGPGPGPSVPEDSSSLSVILEAETPISRPESLLGPPVELPPVSEAHDEPLPQEAPHSPFAEHRPEEQLAKDPEGPVTDQPADKEEEAPACVEHNSTPQIVLEEPTAAPIIQTPSSLTLSIPPRTSEVHTRTPSLSILGPTPKLTRPPTISFDCEPVSWKGLSLDAALWTFDSKELQSIVSRAIRSSALESFIRLLTLESLDQSLPDELKRLESSKNMTQAKYRFLVHRRTMQLQALLSSSLSPLNTRDKDNDDGMPTNTKLVTQLSETVAECDLVMEEILKVTDQINQIKKLIEHHWASALAIALRKLNGSFGRRTADLAKARERIVQLEAALDEAWNEAERMAREMDNIDAVLSDDDDDAIIETAEKVSVSLARATSPSPGPDSLPLSSLLLNPELKPDNSTSLMQLSQLSPLLPVSKSKASKENQTPTDVHDSVSIRSMKSTKSTKSARELTRTTSVSAARTRSYRASQSSLRLPSGLNRKLSNASRPIDNSENQLPPVPNLPLQFSPPSVMMNAPSANASSTLLHHNSTTEASPYRMGRASLDSARDAFGHQTPLPWQNSTMDDIHIGGARKDSTTLGRSLGDESGIVLVPRTPPPAAPKVISMDQHAARPRPRRASKDGGGIPSIWMNVDTPKTPAERVDSLMRKNSKGKNQTYQRLRTLTKRYSLPFPIFASKSNPSFPDSERRPSSHRSR